MKGPVSVLAAILALTSCDGSQMTTSAELPAANLENEASVVRASGSGHMTVTGADTDWRSFSFHATGRPDGTADGRFQLQPRQNDPDHKILGDIVCVTVVGNKAWMVGRVTESDSPNSPVGTFTRFRVADNGEGEGSPPDQISLMEVGVIDPPPYCVLVPERPELRDIEAGNIQVR